MPGSLDDKTAIVTGGGSGIGEALGLELARRGAHVVVADINRDDAERVAAAIKDAGGSVSVCCLDVTDEQEVRRVVEETAAEFGSLDYIFNNAGIAIGGDARDLSPEQWRRVIEVDLYGVLNGTLAAYPIMARQGFGHIVNTSSMAGLLFETGNAPYTTAKHALIGLSLTLRAEGADLGVKVSAVCPGFVATNIFTNAEVVNLAERAQAIHPPMKMVPTARAAELILAGVARNRAIIIFPAYMRLVWRGYRLFPRLINDASLRRIRRLREYRIAS
jgi:NAD(P)-dependent dehydrogenase (short-subunit alcohol dehydrogenase family)